MISFQLGMQEQALVDLEDVWSKMFPEYPLEYNYVSSIYRNVYSTELLQAKLLSIFTFIALFICSIGLLGMSLLSTQRRIREIGIRKVNGAGTNKILVMNKWLENFAYTTSLSCWIFALAGFADASIALITVSIQTCMASSKNPVQALRYE